MIKYKKSDLEGLEGEVSKWLFAGLVLKENKFVFVFHGFKEEQDESKETPVASFDLEYKSSYLGAELFNAPIIEQAAQNYLNDLGK